MEEANERLVKLFFESKGFFVRTNYKVKIKDNVYLEADILAIRSVNKHKDDLPNAVMAEVKSWRISPSSINELFKLSNSKLNKDRQKSDASKLKLINNFEYRKLFFKKLKEEFGISFKFVIVAKDFASKHKEKMVNFLDKKGVTSLSMEKIAEDVKKYALDKSYSNDPELQIIRILNNKKVTKL